MRYYFSMKIYFATGNAHKRIEMQQLFSTHQIVMPSDEGIQFDPEETGKSFLENSMIKALALWNIVQKPVIADDSGLCVDCLGGAPGIYSSRYAGPHFMHGRPDGKKIAQQDQNRMLIDQVNETHSSDRTCRYVCAMVCMITPNRFFTAQETMEGSLICNLSDAAGSGGFGYDPIVLLPQFGKTVAQISSDEKNAISHRGKAARALLQIVNSL